jgi:DNA-binding MarR family transcriptional regulator
LEADLKTSSSGMVPPDHIRRRYHDFLPPGHALTLEVLFALRAGVQGVDNALARWLGHDAMTPGRLQVLAVLWARNGPVPQREIVGELKVSRPTVSGLVETLVAEGHVTATPDPSDKRQVLVALTPAGLAMTERLVRDNTERLRETFGALSDDELRTLSQLLRRLQPTEDGKK